MVHKSIRGIFSIKKFTPYAVLSTPFFLFSTQTIKAAPVSEDTISHFKPELLFNPHTNISNPFNLVSDVKQFYSDWQNFFAKVNEVIEWFHDLPAHIAQWSVNLLTWIYELVSALVLQTPLWLFKNTWFADTSLVFASISIGLIVLLTSIESIKQILGRKHVDFKNIITRLPIALIGAGAAPFLFEKTFQILNALSKAITKIGASEIRSEDFITASKLSGIDTAALIGFDAILIMILFPLILHTGRRWFDLITLGVMTPLAMTCWIFDNYRHLFNKWWSSITRLSLVQLVYASFICVMGIFIFGTRNVIDGYGFYMKILVVIGGLWRLANPPNFVTKYGDSGKNAIHMYKDLKDIFGKKALKPFKLATQTINKFKKNS